MESETSMVGASMLVVHAGAGVRRGALAHMGEPVCTGWCQQWLGHAE